MTPTTSKIGMIKYDIIQSVEESELYIAQIDIKYLIRVIEETDAPQQY